MPPVHSLDHMLTSPWGCSCIGGQVTHATGKDCFIKRGILSAENPVRPRPWTHHRILLNQYGGEGRKTPHQGPSKAGPN